MKLTRSLLVLDIECTSLDPATSRIIELGVSVLHPDGTVKPDGWSRRFYPECPIPPESTSVHGITDADVKDCPPFSVFAKMIHERLQGKDLAGFNLRRLDLPVLDSEMRRNGLKISLEGVHVIDAFGIFAKKNPRTLSDAVLKYTGKPHEGAHGAGADASATLAVLRGQIQAHEDLTPMELAELATFSRMTEYEYVDIAGKLYRDQDGHMRFGFGKNRDQKVLDQMGYCRWMLEKGEFPGSTLDALSDEIDRSGK